MAEPARKYDPDPPRAQDPFNPVPPPPSDPARPDTLTTDTTDPRRAVDDSYAEPRRGMSGVVVAAIILILAAIAFYVFAPGTANVPTTQPQSTAPTEPATPPAAPAPSGTQPTQPAPAAPAQ